jgi:Glycosyl hydrolase family 20, domain 2
MYALLPEPKEYQKGNGRTKAFNRIGIEVKNAAIRSQEALELLEMKLWNFPEINVCHAAQDEDGCLNLVLTKGLEGVECKNPELFLKQGYILDIRENGAEIIFEQKNGLVNGLSTLKQLFKNAGDRYYFEAAYIKDWPTIEQRSVSNTFGWYAGYGRLGFDMQLWGYDEWVEYLNICSDFKINQFNMCMYGYWPFEFDEYPETVLRNYRVKVWNKESRSWITVEYLHPNLADEFLTKLIVANRRNRVIYDLAIASVNYDHAIRFLMLKYYVYVGAGMGLRNH